jgi:hypothetical protein
MAVLRGKIGNAALGALGVRQGALQHASTRQAHVLTGRRLVGSAAGAHTSMSAANTTSSGVAKPKASLASRCVGGHPLLLTAAAQADRHERNPFQIARLLRLVATPALDPWMRPDSTAHARLSPTRLPHACVCATQLIKLEAPGILEHFFSCFRAPVFLGGCRNCPSLFSSRLVGGSPG